MANQIARVTCQMRTSEATVSVGVSVGVGAGVGVRDTNC